MPCSLSGALSVLQNVSKEGMRFCDVIGAPAISLDSGQGPMRLGEDFTGVLQAQREGRRWPFYDKTVMWRAVMREVARVRACGNYTKAQHVTRCLKVERLATTHVPGARKWARSSLLPTIQIPAPKYPSTIPDFLVKKKTIPNTSPHTGCSSGSHVWS